MKYLQTFNEQFSYDNLKQTCEEYLAYLIDDNFDIKVKDNNIDNNVVKYRNGNRKVNEREKVTKITIGKDFFRSGNSSKGTLFNWNDVKDDILPFIEFIKGKEFLKDTDDILFIAPGPYGGPNNIVNERTMKGVLELGKVNFASNSTITNISAIDIKGELDESYITNDTGVLLGIEIIIYNKK